MRVLGIDLGSRRIGIALSDPSGIIAGQLTVIKAKGQRADIKAVKALIKENDVECVVIGLPLRLSGEEGIEAKRALGFRDELRKVIRIPVECVDERFSSKIGNRALIETGESREKRKDKIDQVAAQLILQQYLDMNRSKG